MRIKFSIISLKFRPASRCKKNIPTLTDNVKAGKEDPKAILHQLDTLSLSLRHC